MCNLVPVETETCGIVFVADIKRPHIENLLEQAKKLPNVKEVILFGSILHEHCTEESDIDVAITGSLEQREMILSKEFDEFVRNVFRFDREEQYDFLYKKYDKEPKLIWKKVMENGKHVIRNP